MLKTLMIKEPVHLDVGCHLCAASCPQQSGADPRCWFLNLDDVQEGRNLTQLQDSRFSCSPNLVLPFNQRSSSRSQIQSAFLNNVAKVPTFLFPSSPEGPSQQWILTLLLISHLDLPPEVFSPAGFGPLSLSPLLKWDCHSANIPQCFAAFNKRHRAPLIPHNPLLLLCVI